MPLSKYIFDMTDLLCQRYSSLNPFNLSKEKAVDVFRLVKQIDEYGVYESSPQNKTHKLNKRVEVNEFTATGGWF